MPKVKDAAARSVKRPADYNQIDIHDGYRHYDEMCVMCHGAPGVDRPWPGDGLYPKPPRLYLSVTDTSPEEAFWILKNGIKDTDMPALASVHPDDDIWKIAAFVKKLPEMKSEEYKALGQDSSGVQPPAR
jgi:mono/diheme cytochrome c family protein